MSGQATSPITACVAGPQSKCYEDGIFLPFFQHDSGYWQGWAAAYFLMLIWFFLGIAMLTDTFMSAIEAITSAKRTIRIHSHKKKNKYKTMEVKFWNETVATLLLGANCPVIMIGIVELVGSEFKAGFINPGTVLGSSAFNLFFVSAICISLVPNLDTKRIRQFDVFWVAIFFSLWAFVWAILVVMVVTPDYVDLWEAILTLIMFTVFVLIAFIVDKEYFKERTDVEKWALLDQDCAGLTVDESGNVDSEAVRRFLKELGRQPKISEEDMAKLATTFAVENKSHSHFWYRVQASRNIGGAPDLSPLLNDTLLKFYTKVKNRCAEMGSMGSMTSDVFDLDSTDDGDLAVIEFAATSVAVVEMDKRVHISVKRYGRTDNRVIFKFETFDGTAEAGNDYVEKKETVVFEREETHKIIDIDIVDDNESEPNEIFFAKVSIDPEASDGTAILGRHSVCQIIIIDDDAAGVLEIEKPSYLFKESARKASIPVARRNGADGKVGIKWRTVDITAISGRDFLGGSGDLVFEHGEVMKMIEIPIVDSQDPDREDNFKVAISAPTGGATLGASNCTIVSLVRDDEFDSLVSRLVASTNVQVDDHRPHAANWADQFKRAMDVGGDVRNANGLDYTLHFFTFGWKVLFAFLPPPSIGNGWLTFTFSLTLIGVLSVFVVDLAKIFGCLAGCRDTVTAITLIAVGIGLSDLVACCRSARRERFADAALIGITANCGINVFLGLGIPWFVGAIYWSTKGSAYMVPALTFDIGYIIFVVFTVFWTAAMVMRRFIPAFGSGELGGKVIPKSLSTVFLLVLWLVFVLLTSLGAYKYIASPV
ncbi:sodium/calcium exchanger 1-like [Lineus longissimus]|uniref:sodium/calcium exchanger 1-like n=1 Tax=Lineus longissimus TaxID=88925 RepID=UPI002B4EFF28